MLQDKTPNSITPQSSPQVKRREASVRGSGGAERQAGLQQQVYRSVIIESEQ
jgi:hypothetical protein